MTEPKAGRRDRLSFGGGDPPGSEQGPGVLYLVSTPIGNLEDITLRAIAVLKDVAWIAAEDTRRTAILLAHHGIRKPLIAYHAHTEHRRLPALLERLRVGSSGALVTDAGTPGISDPGFLLAREARGAGIRVEVIPGASAVMAALLHSGLPCERFVFLGYPPAKGAARDRFLAGMLEEQRTCVLFEAPHRIERMLEEIARAQPDRKMAVCREMTKRFEEVLRGTAAEILEAWRIRLRKGEMTVVVAPRGRGDA